MSTEQILIDETERIVAGYQICWIFDGYDKRGTALIARVDTDGPQDLCAERNEKCWVVESTSAASQQLWDIGYWENGDQVFQRVRTATATWPTVLIDDTQWTLRIDADGAGNLYFMKYNRLLTGLNSRGYDPVIALQRTTTANSHAAATVDVDSLAPTGPGSYVFFRGGRVYAVMVQESGLLAIVDYIYADASMGGTTKQIGAVLSIDTSLSGSTAVLLDEDLQVSSQYRPLPDGTMIWFGRASGGGNKTGHVDSLAALTNEVAALPYSPWYFDAAGNYWTWEESGGVYSYLQYDSDNVDVTPAWLAAIGGENGDGFIVTSMSHRFAHTIMDGVLEEMRYRVYDMYDGTLLLDRPFIEGTGGTDGDLPVGYIGGDPDPMNNNGGKTNWQQTTDGRFVTRNLYYKGPAKSAFNWDAGIMKQAPDSILATALVANCRLNSSGFERFQVFVNRGNHANFSYAGW